VVIVGVGGVGVEDMTVAATQRAVFLASAPHEIGPSSRVCRILCGHDERWFPCPRCTPLLYGAAREGPLLQ
jgi:hypothetical protein